METPETNAVSEQQEKIDFFLVTAHELRTSLTAMKWLFKMLLDQDFGTLNSEQRRMILQATTANERMISLVSATLTIVKTAGSSVPYLTLPVSLNDLVEDSIKDFRGEAASKGMHIKYTSPVEPIIVTGDASKLRIAIHNLIENAIKYGNRDTDISIGIDSKENMASITILDKGICIPVEDQPKIFRKFFRASNTNSEHYAGVGLGLYASKHIIERHGGTLSFTSSKDLGTEFKILIPLSKPFHNA